MFKNSKYSIIYIIFCICITSGCEKQKEQISNYTPQENIREGDLVFRRGIGLASQFVLLADKKGMYSHIGIVVLAENKYKIVHAVPGEPDSKGSEDRVKIDDIDTFFANDRAKSGAIMRIGNDSIALHAAKEALRIYNKGMLFDHKYNLRDTSQMYCTELIHFVYSRAGIDLTEGRRNIINLPSFSGEYIFPSDIQQNTSIKTIYIF